MASTDLYDAMVELRDVCHAALEDTPDGPPPDCAIYVDAGPPSFDLLPSLIVFAGGPYVGDTFPLQPSLAPGHRVTVMAEVDLVSLTVVVLRCAPPLTEEGNLPDPTAHEAAARQTSADLWAIWNHVKQAKRDGTLFAPKEREFFLEPAVAVNQSGGACGWQIGLRTQLDGYKPTP